MAKLVRVRFMVCWSMIFDSIVIQTSSERRLINPPSKKSRNKQEGRPPNVTQSSFHL